MAHDDLPFEGVKVLDLSQGVAGPRHSLTEVEYFHALEGQVIMRHL